MNERDSVVLAHAELAVLLCRALIAQARFTTVISINADNNTTRCWIQTILLSLRLKPITVFHVEVFARTK